jgi:hypothetical protein
MKIGKVFIVIHGPDKEKPFVPVDVTEEAKSCCKRMNDKLWDLNRLQKQPDEIAAALGEQGSKPYECRYCGCCRGQASQTVTD